MRNTVKHSTDTVTFKFRNEKATQAVLIHVIGKHHFEASYSKIQHPWVSNTTWVSNMGALTQ